MRNEDVYQISDNAFIEAVKSSKNTHEALLKMGLNSRGAAYKTFRRRCHNLNLDLSHFTADKKVRNETGNVEIVLACANNCSLQATLKMLNLNPHSNANVRWLKSKINILGVNCDHWTKQGHLKNKTHNWANKKPLSEILSENSSYLWSTNLKNRLLNEGLLDYKCYNCSLSEWLGAKISLQLEHKNGNNVDNRIENLCLLCPNCHSQTSTFAGRNIGKITNRNAGANGGT